jgi:hypothetical protein
MDTSKKSTIHWFRWYDRYPNLRAIIKLSEDLSPESQHEIGEKLLTICKRYWRMPYLKKWDGGGGIPSDIISSIRKGCQKNRWYDHIIPMYKALNLILMLPPTSRLQLDKECALLVGYISTYKKGVSPVRTITLPIAPFNKKLVKL